MMYFRKDGNSLKSRDKNLFIQLLLYTLLPSIYLLIRMHIVQTNNVDINIMGQLEWFDLIDEALSTFLLTPLYFLLKQNKYRLSSGNILIFAAIIYFSFSAIVATHIKSIVSFMEAPYAENYLKMQLISLATNFLLTFSIILFTINTSPKCICAITVSKLSFQIIFDILLIPRYLSLGAAYSEIASNTIVGIIALILAYRTKYLLFAPATTSLYLDWFSIGFFSALQICIDNVIYAIMVCKMVNSVNEAGNYWIANNFIWGWILVPITVLSEIIKKSNTRKLTYDSCWKHLLQIILCITVTIPSWKSFLRYGMACGNNTEAIFSIVMQLAPYYIAYGISAVIDSWFVSKGATVYIAINSIIVNFGYYGYCYLRFKNSEIQHNINYIIELFGEGMVVHTIISVVLYVHHQKAKQIKSKQ